MGTNQSKPSLLKAGIAACALFLASGTAMAQSAVTLTAAPTTTTLPDGQVVPMWGYTCGAATLAGAASPFVSCTAANGTTQVRRCWQPPLIRVPAGRALNITLVNNLAFPTGSGANNVPTSLVIVGQLGGGLGTDRATMPSPVHAPQGTTWPGTQGTRITTATVLRPARCTVDFGGTGYHVNDVVAITGGGGSGATAVVTIASGSAAGVNITVSAAGYTNAPHRDDRPASLPMAMASGVHPDHASH